LQLRHYALAALVAGAIAVWPGACSRGRIAPQGDENGTPGPDRPGQRPLDDLLRLHGH